MIITHSCSALVCYYHQKAHSIPYHTVNTWNSVVNPSLSYICVRQYQVYQCILQGFPAYCHDIGASQKRFINHITLCIQKYLFTPALELHQAYTHTRIVTLTLYMLFFPLLPSQLIRHFRYNVRTILLWHTLFPRWRTS